MFASFFVDLPPKTCRPLVQSATGRVDDRPVMAVVCMGLADMPLLEEEANMSIRW
jgi:hypothetical protein